MIGTAIAAFGGSSAITAILMIIVKVWDRKKEAEERKDIFAARESAVNIKALDALAHRTNNIWGNFTRLWLVLSTDLLFAYAIVYSAQHPEIVLWVGADKAQSSFSFLGLIEFKWGETVTWRDFSGMVLVPVVFARMGAVSTYYLIGGMWSRR